MIVIINKINIFDNLRRKIIANYFHALQEIFNYMKGSKVIWIILIDCHLTGLLFIYVDRKYYEEWSVFTLFRFNIARKKIKKKRHVRISSHRPCAWLSGWCTSRANWIQTKSRGPSAAASHGIELWGTTEGQRPPRPWISLPAVEGRDKTNVWWTLGQRGKRER